MNYKQTFAGKMGLQNFEDYIKFPKFLTIETCDYCNAKCVMCPKGMEKHGEHSGIMDDDTFLILLDELRSHADWINMICMNSDGEPLLDKKLAERIRRLKDIGIKHVYFSTNGALLSEEKIRELLRSKVDDIRISINGFTKGTYEKIMAGLKYEQVMNHIHCLIRMRDAMKSNTEIRLRMVEMDENACETEEWMTYWKGNVSKLTEVTIRPKPVAT